MLYPKVASTISIAHKFKETTSLQNPLLKAYGNMPANARVLYLSPDLERAGIM
jgi:hypothetical protein